MFAEKDMGEKAQGQVSGFIVIFESMVRSHYFFEVAQHIQRPKAFFIKQKCFSNVSVMIRTDNFLLDVLSLLKFAQDIN